MGRFLTKDTWQGNIYKPISYNKWTYANNNPLYYTDPSGNIPFPIFLLLLSLGITAFGTSGCNTGPEPITCHPLPANLESESLKAMSSDAAISEIQNYFRIQLPPPATYTDMNGQLHSTSLQTRMK